MSIDIQRDNMKCDCGGEAHLMWVLDGMYHFKCPKCNKTFQVPVSKYHERVKNDIHTDNETRSPHSLEVGSFTYHM